MALLRRHTLPLLATSFCAAAAVAAAAATAGVLGAASPAGAARTTQPSLGGHEGKAPMQTAKTYISAAIIPTETYSVGNSLPSGPDGRSYGFALSANGIDGLYVAATSPKTTFDFLFFVFSNNHSVTEHISFSVVSPSNATVYQYSFKPAVVSQGGSWFTVSATGNFEAKGTYFAEVHAGTSLIGWVPLNFIS
jgi:hypothetical protein